jgi:prephenate dehydrogenase
MTRVGIVGLGLIGGSLGLALRALGRSVEVVGVARTIAGAGAAQSRGAVDHASVEFRDLAGSDIVIIATPINQVAGVLEQLPSILHPAAVITDVASVKRAVVERAQGLPQARRFIGGHPMAGKTRAGLDQAEAGLFRDAPWIFTPFEDQDLNPFEPWFALVRAIGARPRFMPAQVHDRQMAYLSHLAFTLSSAYARASEPVADAELAGPGFKGMVRLADGDAALYEDIAMANRVPLLNAIDRFTAVLAD